MLMAMETEKGERLKRQRNVIVSDSTPEDRIDDMVLYEKFCEDCLTVKLHPVASRRIGKPTKGKPQKLRITLETSLSVDDLIESSLILRNAPNIAINRIYFNRVKPK